MSNELFEPKSRIAAALHIAQHKTPRRRTIRASLSCESLEVRQLLSAETSVTSLSQLSAQTNLTVIPAVTTGPTGLTPQEIQNAYGVNLISFSGGTISGTGQGQTIAIVDAYNDPKIASDLTAFDKEFGLPNPPSFTVDNLGATTTNAGWALETSLDVEWAHAIAPEANIVLVEASSASLNSLFSAVSSASQLAGVTVVSMSWGTNEFLGESAYNSVFTTPAGHANVTFVAASGDQGAWDGPEYPSVAPNVLAVGGTTLTLTSSGAYSSESGWSDSTGGFSGLDNGFFSYQSEPSYQTSALAAAGLNFGVRTTPDVSFNSDPNSGVSVYDSVAYDGQSGWFTVGGTSAAAPAWAGLVAITDQGLAAAGKGSLNTTQVLTNLYSLPSSDFNDVTTGYNGYSANNGVRSGNRARHSQGQSPCSWCTCGKRCQGDFDHLDAHTHAHANRHADPHTYSDAHLHAHTPHNDAQDARCSRPQSRPKLVDNRRVSRRERVIDSVRFNQSGH